MIRTELVCFLSHPTLLFIVFQKVCQITKMPLKFGQITKMSLLGWQEYKVDQIYQNIITWLIII
jgi:hypothetical protein